MALPKRSEVNRLVRLWKARLGLQSWAITWKWVQQDVLNQETGYAALASTGCDSSELRAVINFSLDVQWTIDEFYSDHNFEDTVVHELLHIRMAAADDKVDSVRYMLGTALSPEQGRIVGKLLDEARERYIEMARTLVQEAFQWKK